MVGSDGSWMALEHKGRCYKITLKIRIEAGNTLGINVGHDEVERSKN